MMYGWFAKPALLGRPNKRIARVKTRIKTERIKPNKVGTSL